MTFNYRPWGYLHWILPRCGCDEWTLIGCLGTEERSLATLTSVPGLARLTRGLMLRIADKDSRFSDQTKARLLLREDTINALNTRNAIQIENARLLAPKYEYLQLIDNYLGAGTQSVILDITSMPKRFFFPVLRRLMTTTDSTVRNLIVTYTRPQTYHTGKLAENFEQWNYIPGFSGDHYSRELRPQLMIVSLGFEEFSLKEHVQPLVQGEPVKLLFPFPSPLSTAQRSWSLVQKLYKGRSPDDFELFRVNSIDVSDTYDRMLSLTSNGRKKCMLAPFGPKPDALAMCLLAMKQGSPVWYTQPTVYHPDYSTGVSMCGANAEVYAYCLRLNGRDFY